MNLNDIEKLGVPDQVLSVVPQVEQRTGIPIEFREIDEAAKSKLGQFAKAEAVLDIDAQYQTIRVWIAPECRRAHAITHELLHLKRDVLEGSPRWFPSVDAPVGSEALVFSLQTELDHLYVIPEEIALHPEAQGWWDNHYEETIGRAAERQDHFAIAMHWALLRTTMPESNRAMLACAERVRTLPSAWLRVINNYQCDVRDALHDPMALMAHQIAFVRQAYPDDAQYFMRGKYISEGGRLGVKCL
ncbi:MAG: hypothetical protein ACN6PV_24455 [Achromobacter sp.]|uniref:hypothetical protein n=1 Tax=Achromobacter sp. TaxID=134375 RepID=UPI003D01668F